MGVLDTFSVLPPSEWMVFKWSLLSFLGGGPRKLGNEWCAMLVLPHPYSNLSVLHCSFLEVYFLVIHLYKPFHQTLLSKKPRLDSYILLEKQVLYLDFLFQLHSIPNFNQTARFIFIEIRYLEGVE